MAYWGAPWFRPHRFGIGATPVTWQAWAVIAAFLILSVGLPFAPLAIGRMLVARGLLLVLLLIVAWAKTEGGWRWRWGRRE